MKTSILILSILAASIFIQGSAMSQNSDSDYSGLWKCSVKVSNKKESAPTFIFLKADHTYYSGSDASAIDTSAQNSIGVWSIAEGGDIKFVPSDTAAEVRYYKSSGDGRYKYYATDKDGNKAPILMLEMDFYMEKYGGQ